GRTHGLRTARKHRSVDRRAQCCRLIRARLKGHGEKRSEGVVNAEPQLQCIPFDGSVQPRRWSATARKTAIETSLSRTVIRLSRTTTGAVLMNSIYLDNAATTPMRREVREAMRPYFSERFGNASSLHRWGREARAALEEARERLASAIGAQPSEIVFTRGGTEADNLAILGRSRLMRGSPVVCSEIEHKAVLATARAAEGEGNPLRLLSVASAGRVDPEALSPLLDEGPAVVSVMWVNNEIGVVQPVDELAARCAASGVVFHTDAVQGLGKVPV